MHKLPGPFYNLRDRKVKTIDHNDLTHVRFSSTTLVTATASSNADGYVYSSSWLPG